MPLKMTTIEEELDGSALDPKVKPGKGSPLSKLLKEAAFFIYIYKY